jgi:exosome complex component RRP40
MIHLKSVLPGDNLSEVITSALPSNVQTTRLGGGLISSSVFHGKRRRSETIPLGTSTSFSASAEKDPSKNLKTSSHIIATVSGDLTYRAPDRFFVLNQPKFYTPMVGDTVIGIVLDEKTSTTSSTSLPGVAAGGEGSGPELAYKVRLQGSSIGLLPQLAFEGASKRNKPTLAVGSAIFCRVATVSKYLDPELSCCVISGPRKEWMTGQALFGELKGGTLVSVSISFARTLLDPNCPLLEALGAAVPFEMAVGLNGVVWVNAKELRHVVAITAVLERCESLSEKEQRKIVKQLKGAGAFS